ncbi:MAG: 30S ribosomal protein S10 [bacterium]
MKNIIKICLKAYDYSLLDKSVKKIVDTIQKTESVISGPIPLPTKIKRYTVLRSPFVDKKSREQFEIRVHKRLIEILDPESKTIDALMKLDIPTGVYIEIKS